MSDNGSWNGMMEQVSSGIADVGVSSFLVTKEGSEVVAYTDALGFLR
jgi:ABC-type amino acid transport substrate-binding protein